MTSQINTNGINVNYPVPGTNNSSQGFRDNFAQIRTQINTGANEITDLQSKVLLKAALNNTVLNNDMANALISNASTSGFRATTYNLGNALSGTVVVDVNRADVQYGSLTGNLILQFGNWAPTNTQSNVVLRLTYANASTTPAYVSLPSSCIDSNNNFGVTLLENYANVNGTATLSAPATANIIELRFSTIDCGNTITVEPVNRPYQSTEIQTRSVPPTGLPGDVNGAVAVGTSVGQLDVTSTVGTGNYVVVASTSGLYTDLPIVFTGNTDSANSNIDAGITYYVSDVANVTHFTIADSSGTEINVGSSTQDFFANPASYLYICTGTYNSNAYSKSLVNTFATGNVIELSGTANVAVNAPIIFSGNVDTANTNIVADQVYYVKTISSPNVTVSQSRVDGIAGTAFVPGTKAGLTAIATAYTEGNDIWKRITLTSW